VSPEACERCLRRAWLIAGLAPEIERVLEGHPRRRARELLALEDGELAGAVGANGPESTTSEPIAIERMRATLEAARCWACCLHDPAYPRPLRDLDREAPACLFGRGRPERLELLGAGDCVTVVGSRRPSAYGREIAVRLGRELGSAGVTVVSGMALGIDSCAHEGTLSAERPTVAVLGGGADVLHPARKRRLYGEIVERGLVLSELPPGVRPRRWTFPARNRIMAALGAMTVVVEARRRSGSLITVQLAADIGREIGAVPGRVGASSAEGTNQLLRDGAQLIRSGQDVLDSLLGPGAGEAKTPRPGPALEPELLAVLESVEGGAGNLDTVARVAGLAASAAAVALTRLELLGYVSVDASGRYERTTLDVGPSHS
jgi:DNA processing protein